MRILGMALSCLCAGAMLAPCGVFAQTAAPAASAAPARAAAPAAPAAAVTPAAPATGGARTEAGKIELVTGAVVVTGPDRARRTPKQGDMLYEGDAVATGVDGELHAEMVDTGVIAVRPNTEMSITKYQAQGDANDTSVFGLVKGSFRSITGWIGRNNPKRYQIVTPTATIGVRGTDHEPLVIPEGSAQGTAGTYDKVAAGGSFIQGKSGRVDVTPGKTGFFSQSGRDRPRLLAATPNVYRPARNDTRLEGRHERVRQVMDQRRGERQQVVRQQRVQQQQQQQNLRGTKAAQDTRGTKGAQDTRGTKGAQDTRGTKGAQDARGTGPGARAGQGAATGPRAGQSTGIGAQASQQRRDAMRQQGTQGARPGAQQGQAGGQQKGAVQQGAGQQKQGAGQQRAAQQQLPAVQKKPPVQQRPAAQQKQATQSHQTTPQKRHQQQ